ncbi:adenosine receptor A3-like [Stylophora pistillata]|uniref:adenosine receptor A3-like n=1 Tax=Stylophora pistillata TaxID=50429 RepID=UPI000C0466B7|nr:adenosine receptor A3-like [Stylophora pistillata]
MPSCQPLLQKPDVDDIRSTGIASYVLSSFLSCTAILLNIATIHGIRKTSSLSNTLKIFLLSLAVSDVCVGLVVQPFFISIVVRVLQRNIPGCTTYRAFDVISHVFSGASFFGVIALSVDRFLALHLHLRYQELVTHKRVVAVVISIWLFSFFIAFSILWVPNTIRFISASLVGIVCILLTKIAYCKIYLTVKRHKNHIQSSKVRETPEEQFQRVGEMTHFVSLVKTAVGVFCVYLVFLMCHLPFVAYIVFIAISRPTIALKRLNFIASIFVFLNSSLNPVVYCWKMRHIRSAIINVLRSITTSNRTSVADP